MKYLPALIVAALALVPWKFAVDAYLHTREVMAGYASATGEVVGYASRISRSAGSGSSSVQHYPIVHFTAPGGELVRFESEFGASDMRYPVGERVDVLYDRAQPQTALINEFRSLWLSPLLFFGFGMPFVVFGGWLYLRSHRR